MPSSPLFDEFCPSGCFCPVMKFDIQIQTLVISELQSLVEPRQLLPITTEKKC